jgi:hypothetical protein
LKDDSRLGSNLTHKIESDRIRNLLRFCYLDQRAGSVNQLSEHCKTWRGELAIPSFFKIQYYPGWANVPQYPFTGGEIGDPDGECMTDDFHLHQATLIQIHGGINV